MGRKTVSIVAIFLSLLLIIGIGYLTIINPIIDIYHNNSNIQIIANGLTIVFGSISIYLIARIYLYAGIKMYQRSKILK